MDVSSVLNTKAAAQTTGTQIWRRGWIVDAGLQFLSDVADRADEESGPDGADGVE